MISQHIEFSKSYQVSFTGKNISKNRKSKLTLSKGESIYKLSSGYIGKYQSQIELSCSKSDNEEDLNMPELAALILCRTQLRRGQPENALDLLTKFIENYGETPNIEIERKKVLSALERP